MAETIDFINSILFWVFLFVLIWQAYYLLCGKGVPNISTAPAIRRAIIEKLKGLSAENPVIYDLGCANGQFTREIAKAMLSNANAIFMFQLGRDMGDMRPKLEKDLKPGTLVIANKFKIGGEWEPAEVITVKTLAPAQKTFYVYEV